MPTITYSSKAIRPDGSVDWFYDPRTDAQKAEDAERLANAVAEGRVEFIPVKDGLERPTEEGQ